MCSVISNSPLILLKFGTPMWIWVCQCRAVIEIHYTVKSNVGLPQIFKRHVIKTMTSCIHEMLCVEFRELFAAHDNDSDGWISLDEVTSVLKDIGVNVREDEVIQAASDSVDSSKLCNVRCSYQGPIRGEVCWPQCLFEASLGGIPPTSYTPPQKKKRSYQANVCS